MARALRGDSMDDALSVGRAYDAVADDYDRELEPSRWIRRALWLRFDQLFGPGDRVLDAGCGTGIDTVHLASRGVHVTAVDASHGMMDKLRRRLDGTSLESLVDARVGDIADVVRQLAGPFDGIISSFAALNTVDLGSFVPEAARVLAPGGALVAHLLAPHHRATLGRRVVATARPRHRVASVDIELHGRAVTHLLGTRAEVFRRFFSPSFAERRGSWLAPLVALTSVGRFYVLDLELRKDHDARRRATPSR